MKHAVAGSLTALLAGAGLAFAGEDCAPRCGPTVPIPNVKFYRQLPPDPPAVASTLPIPAPTFYKAEVQPPRFAAQVPIPNVFFYRCPPPDVTFYVGKAPPVLIYKAEVQCPQVLPPVKPPQVMLYRAEPKTPQVAPTVPIPNVTFYTTSPVPPGPVLNCPGPGCQGRP